MGWTRMRGDWLIVRVERLHGREVHPDIRFQNHRQVMTMEGAATMQQNELRHAHRRIGYQALEEQASFPARTAISRTRKS